MSRCVRPELLSFMPELLSFMIVSLLEGCPKALRMTAVIEMKKVLHLGPRFFCISNPFPSLIPAMPPPHSCFCTKCNDVFEVSHNYHQRIVHQASVDIREVQKGPVICSIDRNTETGLFRCPCCNVFERTDPDKMKVRRLSFKPKSTNVRLAPLPYL